MKSLVVTMTIWVVFASAVTLCAANPDAPDLLEALRSGDPSARLAAIDALGHRGGKVDGAIPALIEQLGDDSAAIRAHAAHALGRIGPVARSAAEALVGLIGDKDKHVRREAVRALRNIRPGPEVTIPLFNRLLRQADAEVRLYVMDAMAEQGKEVVPPMIRALEHKEACYWACLVLAEIGPDAEAAVGALVKLFESDDRPEVQREAILALAAIGPKAVAAVPALTKVLSDKASGDTEGINVGVAVYALGAIGPKAKAAQETIEKLSEREDTEPLLQTISLWALARMNPDDKQLVGEVVPRLVNMLKSPRPELRTAAARALIDLDPDPEIVRPALDKAMEGADPEVLDHVLDALASLGEKAVPRLIAALKREEGRLKTAAILARIGPPAKAAVPALIEALGDKNPETRSEVLFALAAIGPGAKQAVPAVARALGDPEMDVRYAACYALGKIGPAAMSAKAELQKRLTSPDRFLRQASAWALAHIHPACPATSAMSVPILIHAMGAPDAMTRLEAAKSLRCLGPRAKDAVPALKKALHDDNEQVRAVAAEALKAIAK
jgi:HEAT repeat protein